MEVKVYSNCPVLSYYFDSELRLAKLVTPPRLKKKKTMFHRGVNLCFTIM